MPRSSPREMSLIRAETEPELNRLRASWIRHLKQKGARPDTIASYERVTRFFHAFAQEHGMPGLAGLKREHVEMWFAHLADEGRAPYTQHTYFGWLRQWFVWLEEEGEIQSNPMAKMRAPKVDEVEKDIVEPADLAAVLKRLEKERNFRDAAVIALFYDTGMRRGEVARLRVDDIDLERGLIRLKGSGTKGRFARTVALSPTCVRYIDRYLRRRSSDSPWLLPGQSNRSHPEHVEHLHPNSVYLIVTKAFGRDVRLIGPHDMRHTSATHVSGDMTETELMTLYGWKNADMARHYTRKAHERNAIAAHRRASPLERLGK